MVSEEQGKRNCLTQPAASQRFKCGIGINQPRDLKRFACAVNMASGSVKSFYVTPEEMARETGRPVSDVTREEEAMRMSA